MEINTLFKFEILNVRCLCKLQEDVAIKF